MCGIFFFARYVLAKFFSPSKSVCRLFFSEITHTLLEEEKQAEPEFMSLDFKEKLELFWIITFIIVAVYFPRLCPDNMSQL